MPHTDLTTFASPKRRLSPEPTKVDTPDRTLCKPAQATSSGHPGPPCVCVCVCSLDSIATQLHRDVFKGCSLEDHASGVLHGRALGLSRAVKSEHNSYNARVADICANLRMLLDQDTASTASDLSYAVYEQRHETPRKEDTGPFLFMHLMLSIG